MADGLILAIDTSTSVNVGLARDGAVLGVANVADRMAHVEQLMPLVRRVLAESEVRLVDLAHIVVGLGPGPFTGLRVGVVTAQVLASVSTVPLRGVCSIDALAAQYCSEQHAFEAPDGDFVVATDARRKEVYWARYRRDGARVDGPRVSKPEDVPRLPTVGPGADLYPDRLIAAPGPRALDPGVLADVGLRLPDAGIEPLYLRRPDAAVPSRRKSVLVTRLERRPR